MIEKLTAIGLGKFTTHYSIYFTLYIILERELHPLYQNLIVASDLDLVLRLSPLALKTSHLHSRTCIHTCVLALTLTLSCSCICSRVLTLALTHSPSCICSRLLAFSHSHSHSHSHSRSCLLAFCSSLLHITYLINSIIISSHSL